MSRTRPSIGEYYHVYNRGVEKRIIFLDKHDYWRFLESVYLCNSKKRVTLNDISFRFDYDRGEEIVSVGLYCLMPNHYHLLLREITPGGISKFMQKLGTAYTKYFNARYERTGVLFQGKYKIKHVQDEKYMKWLYHYIHFNPYELITDLKNGKQDQFPDVQKLHTYPFSSFLD